MKNTIIATAGNWRLTGDFTGRMGSDIYDLTADDVKKIESWMDGTTIGSIEIYHEDEEQWFDYQY